MARVRKNAASFLDNCFMVIFSFVVFCSVFADLWLDAAMIGLRLSLRGIAAVRYHLPTQSSGITNADQAFAVGIFRHVGVTRELPS